MRKAIALLVLTVGVGVVAVPGPAPIDAQDKTKTKTKEDAKAKDKRGAAATGTVEIYMAKDGYRFRVKDADGKVIAMPPRAHETKDEVLKSLDEVKAILSKAKPTEVKD